MRRLIFTSAAVAVMALWAAEPIGAAETRNGFSANGFSANGFSANGFSANGFSANGREAGATGTKDGVAQVVLRDGSKVELSR